MKHFALCLIFLAVIASPVMAAYKYSGLPCKWESDSPGADDRVGPKPDDRDAARRDRQIQSHLVNPRPFTAREPGTACWVERGDGRLLLIDPRLTHRDQ